MEMEQSLPLMSWTTTWGVFANGNGGGHVRARRGSDARRGCAGTCGRCTNAGASQSEVVLRAMVDYDHGSVVVRELYKLEPLFQYGIDVGLQLVILRGVKQQAEQLSPSTAKR